MNISTTLSDISDIVDPKSRSIHFGDSPAQNTVVLILRYAWTARVPSEIAALSNNSDGDTTGTGTYDEDAVGKVFAAWAKQNHALVVREEERKKKKKQEEDAVAVNDGDNNNEAEEDDGILMEQNPDKEQVEESWWRKYLIYMCMYGVSFPPPSNSRLPIKPRKIHDAVNADETNKRPTDNHLFFDIGDMLPPTNGRMGHYHAPNSSSWTISYDPSPSASTTVVVKRWDHNIILTPAFLDKNVKVTASRTLESAKEEEKDDAAEMNTDTATANTNAGGTARAEDAPQDVETTAVELGTFSHARGEESTSAWFIKRGVEVTFTLSVVAEAGTGEEEVGKEKEQKKEGSEEGTTRRTGVAAVFAVGTLCVEHHDGEDICC